MTDKELLRLYELRGSVTAQRDIAKCGLHAAHDALKSAPSTYMEGYFNGMMRLHVKAIRAWQAHRREITQIIKEAQNA